LEVQTATKENPHAHGVPKETIINMISDFHEFKESFLESHNADFIIKILPHEFYSIQKSIGEKILNFMLHGKF